MRCGKCNNFIYWVETGSMGLNHSNFYKCFHCKTLYLIEDRYKSDEVRECDIVKQNLSSTSSTKEEKKS